MMDRQLDELMKKVCRQYIAEKLIEQYNKKEFNPSGPAGTMESRCDGNRIALAFALLELRHGGPLTEEQLDHYGICHGSGAHCPLGHFIEAVDDEQTN